MSIHYLTGDATAPTGDGPRIICHVCNDLGRWGRGFVLALSARWPEPEQYYRRMAVGGTIFQLGAVELVPVELNLWVCNMIAQHGLRSAANPVPLHYLALRNCLGQVALAAKQMGASVHCPRIGAGLGGASWSKVEAIINETLGAAGVEVYVYSKLH